MTRNTLKQLGRIGALGMVAVLVLAACGSSDPGTSKRRHHHQGQGLDDHDGGRRGPRLELDGKAFTATGVEGYEPVADSQLTLTFEDGNLSVNAGCNTMTSTYEVNGDQLGVDRHPGRHDDGLLRRADEPGHLAHRPLHRRASPRRSTARSSR